MKKGLTVKKFVLRIKDFFQSSYLFLRKTFISFLVLTISLVILVFLSLQGENSHQKSCKNLDIECEKGMVHTLVEDSYQWGLELIKRIKDEWQGKPKEQSYHSDDKTKIERPKLFSKNSSKFEESF
jgi:hypothetical protein